MTNMNEKAGLVAPETLWAEEEAEEMKMDERINDILIATSELYNIGEIDDDEREYIEWQCEEQIEETIEIIERFLESKGRRYRI